MKHLILNIENFKLKLKGNDYLQNNSEIVTFKKPRDIRYNNFGQTWATEI